MKNIEYSSILPLPCIIKDGEESDTDTSELVYVSSQRWHKQIKYGETLLSGGFRLDFDMTSNSGFNEVWIFHEIMFEDNDGGHGDYGDYGDHGDHGAKQQQGVYISPLCNETLCLTCIATKQGKVELKMMPLGGQGEVGILKHQIWKVAKAPDGFEGVIITNNSAPFIQNTDDDNSKSLCSSTRTYYLSSDGSKVEVLEGFTSSTLWDLQRAHQDNYKIDLISNSADTPRLASKNGAVVVSAKSNERSADHIWNIEKLPNDVICLTPSSKKKFLTACEGHSTVRAVLTEHFSEKCHWELESNGSDEILLKHVKTGRYLHASSSDKEQNYFVLLVTDKAFATGVSLYPSLPEYKPLVPRSVKMIGFGLAAPFAVTGAVSALGFSSGGIVAGSIGARLMSVSAMASGGGVPAGGLVATLQSVGAAGLGACGTFVSTVTGVGLGSIGRSNKQVDRSTASSDGQEALYEKRVFSEWRNW